MRYGVEQPRSQGSLLPALADGQEPWERGWGWKLYVFSFLHIKLFSPAVFLRARICFRNNIFGPSATWPICPSPPMLTERHVKTVKQPKAIRYRVDTSPLQRSVQRSLLLRAVTETALKSPFLCVNRSPIRYGFRACAKAIRLRTIVSSREFVFNCAILNHFY